MLSLDRQCMLCKLFNTCCRRACGITMRSTRLLLVEGLEPPNNHRCFLQTCLWLWEPLWEGFNKISVCSIVFSSQIWSGVISLHSNVVCDHLNSIWLDGKGVVFNCIELAWIYILFGGLITNGSLQSVRITWLGIWFHYWNTSMWLGWPNHDQASVMFSGTGMLWIAARIFCDGAIPSSVSWRPAKSTTFWQNWNLSTISTIPFSVQKVRKSHAWWKACSIL